MRKLKTVLCTALLAAAIFTVGGVGTASAHFSEFCGHYTLRGNIWVLNYSSWHNDFQNRHYHYYAHQSARYGTTYHHQDHYCGARTGTTLDGSQGAVEYPLFTDSGDWIDLIASLIGDGSQVSYVDLDASQLSPFTVISPVLPATGACALSAEQDEDTGDVVFEVASRALAASLDHPC